MSFKLLAFIFCFFCFSVQASEPSASVDIVADKLEVFPNEQHAYFEGNVKIKHGEVNLGADNISVYYLETDGDIKEVIAKGNVIIVHGENTSTGDKATYNPNIGDVLLTGNVVMTRGESVLKGEKLRYDMKTGNMSLANPSNGGRVKATFSLKGKSKSE